VAGEEVEAGDKERQDHRLQKDCTIPVYWTTKIAKVNKEKR
jgi:hypothetical protein